MISQLCTDNKKTNRATRNKGNKCTNRPTNKKGNKTGASQPHNPKVKTSSNQPSSPLKMSDKKQHSAQDLMEEFDRLRTQLAAIFHRLHPEDQAEARATLRSTFPEPATAVNRLAAMLKPSSRRIPVAERKSRADYLRKRTQCIASSFEHGLCLDQQSRKSKRRYVARLAARLDLEVTDDVRDRLLEDCRKSLGARAYYSRTQQHPRWFKTRKVVTQFPTTGHREDHSLGRLRSTPLGKFLDSNFFVSLWRNSCFSL